MCKICKIVFSFAVGLFFLTNVSAQTNTVINPNGYNIFYYPNGRINSEGMMRNNKPDGYWKAYYPTGVMSSEGNRINSLLDSTWVFYTQTGDTLEINNYRLNKKSGYNYQYETVTERNSVSRHYLKSKELYFDDKREGPAYYYYPSGKIKQIIRYRNGKKQDEDSKEFDENGTVITLYKYHNDYMTSREYINRVNAQGEKQGTWISYYPDGTKREEEYYKNGVLDGTTTMYNERGRTINERIYRDGKVIEEGIQMIAEPMEITSYWDDEITIMRKGTYLDSVPIGDHTFYNKEGVPERSIRYSERGTGVRIAEGTVDERGRRTGEWKTYFETGEIRASGKYANNAPVGEWTYFSQDGKKMQTGNFNNGVREGEWKWFFPSGNILREDFLVGGKLNGMSIQYSDSATIVAKGEYVDDEREGFWIEHVGHSREEGKYVMGLKEGIWKTYHKDGQLYHTGNFVQGNADGRHVFYYPDGTLKEEQYYVMGRRDKNWKKYYENGGLFLTITYKNDVETRINGIRIE